MKDCTVAQYLDPLTGGWERTSIIQMRILLRAHEYAVRADICANHRNTERAEAFATATATLAFLAFPDLRPSMERAA